MNPKFFNLTEEKQKRIIDAGYRVFSQNKYKKSPMSEIAMEAEISKALLFHYFKNKKELYIYLYNYGVQLIMEESLKEQLFEERDFFKLYLQGATCKLKIFEKHQRLFDFLVKAYYEDDEEIKAEIGRQNVSIINYKNDLILNKIDMCKFKEGINIKELDNMLNWCTEGYMKDKSIESCIDLKELEEGFIKILDFFKKNSYKEEYL